MQRESHDIASTGGLDTLPEGEIPSGGVRETLCIPSPTAPGDGDTGLGEGGLDGQSLDQPRTYERTIGDDTLELMLPSPVDQSRGEVIGGLGGHLSPEVRSGP